MQLTAQALGLGSCWVQIRNREHAEDISSEAYIREVLGIPADLRVLSIIAVGYPAETREPKPAAELKTDRLHSNGW